MALRIEESEPDDCGACRIHALGYGTGCTLHRPDSPKVTWLTKRPHLKVTVHTEWSDFGDWKWSRWEKWLRRYSLGFMRHPSDRVRKAAMRFPISTRKLKRIGTTGILEPVNEACRLAGLTDRQVEVWTLAEGRGASQRQIAELLRISQPMVHRHLTGARERLASEWGVITSGLVIEGILRGCAWRFRGFECRVCCKQFQTKTTEV